MSHLYPSRGERLIKILKNYLISSILGRRLIGFSMLARELLSIDLEAVIEMAVENTGRR